MDCECGDYLSPSPAIWIMSVMVISFGSSPAIWTECGGHQFGSQPCHIDCWCVGHWLGPIPAIWIVSVRVVVTSLGPSTAI